MAKEKKKKRSDHEILKLTDKFYKELIADSPSKKSVDCRFRSKDGKRHCMATTNKTCSRCNFFEPTTMAKFEWLLRLLEDMRNENAGLRKKVSGRELEIIMLNAELAELKELKNEHDSDGVEPEIVAYSETNDAGTVGEENQNDNLLCE